MAAVVDDHKPCMWSFREVKVASQRHEHFSFYSSKCVTSYACETKGATLATSREKKQFSPNVRSGLRGYLKCNAHRPQKSVYRGKASPFEADTNFARKSEEK